MFLLSFILYIGITFASLAMSGAYPIVSELFIIVDVGDVRASFRSLTN